MFILKRHLVSKSFSAIRETCLNAYPGKEVPNKTIRQRLVTISGHTKCLIVTSAHLAIKQPKFRMYQCEAAHLQVTGVDCKNLVFV